MADTQRVLFVGPVNIGAVTWLDERAIGVFQYNARFAESGLRWRPFRHAAAVPRPMNPDAIQWQRFFTACPECSADSLPDRFRQYLEFNAWLAAQGNARRQFFYAGRTALVTPARAE